MEIILTRAEGPSDECGKPKSFTNFTDANTQLTTWSRSAPEQGGYDKVDFTITDTQAGIEYRGRYDLKHWKVECAHLRGHVVGTLEFRAGDNRPAHMTVTEYESFVSRYCTPEERETCRKLAAYFKEQPWAN